MADNEILKDAELNEVVGGSGIETMGFLLRLQREGLYTPKTPLVAGNEVAATQELKAYLSTFTVGSGNEPLFDTSKIFDNDLPNQYGVIIGYGGGQYRPASVDEVVANIRRYLGR